MMSGRLAVQTTPRPCGLLLDVATAERITGGRWHGSQQDVEIFGAVIDSRVVTPGCLFACLPGAQHDGHDFAATAVGDGAVLICATRIINLPVPVLVVADVTAALAALAKLFRERYASDCTWIGVGGANGKTTVKEMIAAACRVAGPTHATRGNYNNHLGVPLTVLATPPGMQYAVIELGANHPGEIVTLSAIAQPQVGVVVSIGPEHLEGFGDLAGVARAECELFAALPHGAPALIGMSGLAEHARVAGIPFDTLRTIISTAAAGRPLIEIGGDAPSAISVHGKTTSDGITVTFPTGPVRMAVLGAHNIANATLAYHAVLAAGVTADDAQRGLTQVKPVAGRLVSKSFQQHTLLDDTYNANPASMYAGLRVLATMPGERLAVLGSMGELGQASVKAHRDVGAEAARLSLPLITISSADIARGYRDQGGTDLMELDDRQAAVAAVQQRLQRGPHTVLFKASRSAGLDLVLRQVMEGSLEC